MIPGVTSLACRLRLSGANRGGPARRHPRLPRGRAGPVPVVPPRGPRCGEARRRGAANPAPAAGIQGAFCRLPGGLGAASAPPSRPLPAPSRRVRQGQARRRRREHVSRPGAASPAPGLVAPWEPPARGGPGREPRLARLRARSAKPCQRRLFL